MTTAIGTAPHAWMAKLNPSSAPAIALRRMLGGSAKVSASRPGQGEEREQEEGVLGCDEPGRPFHIGCDLPHRIQEAGEERRPPPQSAGDEHDQTGIHCPQDHEAEPGRGECRRVADDPAQGGERGQDVEDAWWMEQQEVAVRDPPMDQRDRRAEVHAVVVVDQAVEPAATEDRDEADEERQPADPGEENEIRPGYRSEGASACLPGLSPSLAWRRTEHRTSEPSPAPVHRVRRERLCGRKPRLSEKVGARGLPTPPSRSGRRARPRPHSSPVLPARRHAEAADVRRGCPASGASIARPVDWRDGRLH